MYRLIDKRGSGKTSHLMLLAKKNDAIIVCSNPYAMRFKAEEYGFEDLTFISYSEYIKHKYPEDKEVYIDNLDMFVKTVYGKLDGYTLCNED